MSSKLSRNERLVRRISERFIQSQTTEKPIGLTDVARAVAKAIKEKYPKENKKSKSRRKRAMKKLRPALRHILPSLMFDGTILVVNQKPMKLVSRNAHYKSQEKK